MDLKVICKRDVLPLVKRQRSKKMVLRSSPAVPKHVKLYGFFYEISSGKLTEVVRDIPA
jgi:carbonic anhydrase